MADKVFKVKVCDMPGCPTPQDDVRRCTLGVNGVPRRPDLCVTHRKPLEQVLEALPRTTGASKTKGIEGKVVRPEDIPKLMTPAEGTRPTKKTTPGRSRGSGSGRRR